MYLIPFRKWFQSGIVVHPPRVLQVTLYSIIFIIAQILFTITVSETEKCTHKRTLEFRIHENAGLVYFQVDVAVTAVNTQRR